jgi:hypothetical protein
LSRVLRYFKVEIEYFKEVFSANSRFQMPKKPGVVLSAGNSGILRLGLSVNSRFQMPKKPGVILNAGT